MAPSNYSAIVESIQATFQAVTGVVRAYDYEPTQYPNHVAVFVVLSEWRSLPPAQGSMEHLHTVAARLSLPYTQNERVEQQLRTIHPAILAAFGVDLDAAGSIPDGQVRLIRARASFVTSASVRYRIVDYTLEAVERVPYTWAL